jgi:hypothetical protein
MRQGGSPTLSPLEGSLAVYTTIYPGVEAYLDDWCRSLRQQTDQEFELWVGLDEVGSQCVGNVLGSRVKVNWVTAPSKATPAQIRQQALSQIVESSSAVVLVDSDDLLHPSRVAAAREALGDSELAGCGLCLIDQQGKSLASTFGLPPQLEPEDVFPRNNVFGFSNSAFRSDLLKRCLPVPADAVLVDWFLATRAWLLGAKLIFDRIPRMDYRQHPANTVGVRFPFSRDQVISDTALVRRHFELVLYQQLSDYVADRYAVLESVARDVEEFHRQVVLHPAKLDEYVEALNTWRPASMWWSCVAYPALGHMWS